MSQTESTRSEFFKNLKTTFHERLARTFPMNGSGTLVRTIVCGPYAILPPQLVGEGRTNRFSE
jgi:hypothetical protein